MWKRANFFLLAAVVALPLSGCTAESEAGYTVCQSTYALCTTAPCQPIAGQDGTVSCACELKPFDIEVLDAPE